MQGKCFFFLCFFSSFLVGNGNHLKTKIAFLFSNFPFPLLLGVVVWKT